MSCEPAPFESPSPSASCLPRLFTDSRTLSFLYLFLSVVVRDKLRKASIKLYDFDLLSFDNVRFSPSFHADRQMRFFLHCLHSVLAGFIARPSDPFSTVRPKLSHWFLLCSPTPEAGPRAVAKLRIAPLMGMFFSGPPLRLKSCPIVPLDVEISCRPVTPFLRFPVNPS